MRERSALLARLRDRPETDVLIVGGGINGVGVFRDLAAQGIAALLVERGDICSGTSAAPSRLVHGGLRYLETGEFALVRESVHEREALLRNAPHLVRPIPTWVPLSGWTGGTITAIGRLLRLVRTPGRKGALVVKLGLVLYDRFAGQARRMPRHRFLSARSARTLLPSLSPHLAAVAEYYDARLVHPERLTLELVADAEADCPGAAAIPYLAAERLAGDRVVLRDMIDGDAVEVRARLVVNAAGAWADKVDAGLGIGEKLTGGTKGSHLVVRDEGMASELGDRMLYFETADRRACLVYALDDIHVLLGTTDLATDDPDDRACTPAEIEYLLRVLTDVIPGRRLSKDNIVFTYAGVRPLPRSDAKVTGAISRDHKIHRFLTGASGTLPLLTLVGGKWTTYRACAAEIADAVMAELGEARIQTTDALAIGGGANWPDGGNDTIAANLVREFGLTEERAKTLAKRYGTAAARIAVLASGSDDVPLVTAPTYTRSEIAALAKHERVTRLEDVVLRRTLLPFEGLATRACIEELGDILAAALGWTAAKRDAEIEATLELMQTRHGLRPSRSDIAEVIL